MADIKLKTRIALRADTKENWNDVANSLVPLKGEFCITLDETGGPKIKVGDGTSLWSALKYINATPEELSAYGVREVKIEGTGNVIANASFSQGILTLTRGTISYNAKTGSVNGTIAFGIPGAETDVAVAGLKSAAFTESSAYDVAGAGQTAANAVLGTAQDPSTANTVYGAKKAAAEASTAATTAQETADNAASAAETAQSEIDALEAKVGTVPDGQTIVQMIEDSEYDDTALAAKVNANTNAITVLNGSGEGSVTKTVADEIAKVVAGAPEDFDTLKEMSDWITEHGSDAAEMNSQIQANKTAIETLNGANTVSGSVAKSIKDAVDPVNSALTAHTSNSEIHVTASDKANWNGKTTMTEVEAKGYQTAAQVKAIKVDNATKADNSDALGGVAAGQYALKSELPTVPVQSVTGNNGIAASLSGTTVTVGINLEDVFILNGGNAAGTYA